MEGLVIAALTLLAAGLNYLRTRKVDKRVEHEFTNNGGSSARDILDHLVIKLDRMDEKLDAHIENHP